MNLSPRFIIVSLALACAAPSCGSPPAPKPQPATCQPATIAGACDRGRELKCAWAEPTAAGVPCEEVIAESLATGIFLVDVGCVACVSTCAQEAQCARNP